MLEVTATEVASAVTFGVLLLINIVSAIIHHRKRKNKRRRRRTPSIPHIDVDVKKRD
jgi:hypothetical protein